MPPQVIRSLRDRFGARINLPEAAPGADERILQVRWDRSSQFSCTSLAPVL